MISAYIYLSIAIAAEVVATTALKAADGFTNLVPTAIVIVGYRVPSIRYLSFARDPARRRVWSMVGSVACFSIARAIYDQDRSSCARGFGLIVGGVLVIRLLSHTNQLTT